MLVEGRFSHHAPHSGKTLGDSPALVCESSRHANVSFD